MTRSLSKQGLSLKIISIYYINLPKKFISIKRFLLKNHSFERCLIFFCISECRKWDIEKKHDLQSIFIQIAIWQEYQTQVYVRQHEKGLYLGIMYDANLS